MTSQITHQEMLKFKLFKKELQGLLDEVLHEAKAIQKTAADPVVLDRSWILKKFGDKMTQDEYILEPKAMEVSQGLGHLHKLPRELRDLIYGYAIANGTTALVRASKQTREETSKIIFEKGIYRLLLGCNEDYKNPRLSRSLAKKVQHLRVRVNSRGPIIFGLDQYLPRLHKFDGSTVQRKECVVTIESDPFTHNMDAIQVTRELVDLTGFERVTLELDLDWGGEPWPDTVEEFENERIRRRLGGALHYQKGMLEPTLGAADVVLDKETQRLSFFPRSRGSGERRSDLD